jgi:hypothetical protein
LKKLEQGKTSIIYQLRSGHLPLNKYLHKIKKIESPDYTTCKVEESVHHYLIKCSRFTNQRKKLRQTLAAEKIKINVNSLRDVLDSPKAFPFLSKFILSTHQFKNLQTYQDHQVD